MNQSIQYPAFEPGRVVKLSEDQEVTIGKHFILPREYVGAFHAGDEFVIEQAWWGNFWGDPGDPRKAGFIRARCVKGRIKSSVNRYGTFAIVREWEKRTFLDRTAVAG